MAKNGGTRSSWAEAGEEMREHYERIIALCGFALTFANIGITSTAFSIFQPHIVEIVGHTGGAAVVFTRSAVTVLAMLVVDRYYVRLDVRLGASLATALTAAGFAVYAVAAARSATLPAFLAGAALAGFGYGFGGMVAATMLLNRWYARRISTAVGFAAVGSGVASIVLPLLTTFLVARLSLTAAFTAQALIGAAIAGFLALAVRNRPADIGAVPFGAATSPALASDAKSPETESRQARRRPSKALGESAPRRTPSPKMATLLTFGVFLFGAGVQNGTNYLTVLMTSQGIAATTAGVLFAAMGLTLTVSKYAAGTLFDKIGTARASAFLFLVLLGSYAAMLATPLAPLPAAMAASILYGMGASLATVGVPVWSLELSDPLDTARSVKRFQLAFASGALAFNLVPGIVASATGSYVPAFAAMTCFVGAAGAIIRAGYRAIGEA